MKTKSRSTFRSVLMRTCSNFPVCLRLKQQMCLFSIIMHNRSGCCFCDGHQGAATGLSFLLQVDGRRRFRLINKAVSTFISANAERSFYVPLSVFFFFITPPPSPELALMLMICLKVMCLLWRHAWLLYQRAVECWRSLIIWYFAVVPLFSHLFNGKFAQVLPPFFKKKK